MKLHAASAALFRDALRRGRGCVAVASSALRRGVRIVISCGCGVLVFESCASAPPIDLAVTTEDAIVSFAHRDDPTPARPRVGCIAPSLKEQSQTATEIVDGKVYAGKRLPEIVRVIGVYESPVGTQWKVLRAGEFNTDNWQPWPIAKIQFNGCGPEANAMSAAVSAANPRGEQ